MVGVPEGSTGDGDWVNGTLGGSAVGGSRVSCANILSAVVSCAQALSSIRTSNLLVASIVLRGMSDFPGQPAKGNQAG
jgi:hypothetical protein